MTVLPPIRSCQTKRWRAAALLPHFNPTQIFDGSEPYMKVKTPLRRDMTLLSAKPGSKGEPCCHLLFGGFHPLMYGLTQVVAVRIPRIPTLLFFTARYRVLTLHAQWLRAQPRQHGSGSRTLVSESAGAGPVMPATRLPGRAGPRQRPKVCAVAVQRW